MKIYTRVLAQLGQDNATYLSSITNPEDVFSRAYWDALSLIPPRVLISNIAIPPNPEDQVASADPNISLQGDNFDVDDKKELLIFRTEANHIMNEAGNAIQTLKFITKPCKKISIENSKKALDPDSIYFATSNSPVYWHDNSNGSQVIKTAPATTGWSNSGGTSAYMPNGNSALQIFAIKRYNFSSDNISAGTSGLANFPLANALGETSSTNLPEELEGFVITKIAHTFLVELIANASLQDEDAEMVTLLTTQSQIFSEIIENKVKDMSERWGANE